MKVATVRIVPLQPLMFRGPGEFDPSSRGVFSHVTSLPIPRPSTLVGMLITAHLQMIPSSVITKRIKNWHELLQQYMEIFNILGIKAIRGPYLCLSVGEVKEILLPIRLGKVLKFAKISEITIELIRETIEALFESKLHNLLGRIRTLLILDKIAEEIGEKVIIPIQRIGIALRDRSPVEISKTAMEGFIYETQLTAYEKNIEIRFKLILDESNKVIKNKWLAVKVGGEQKVAKMIITDEKDEYDKRLRQVNFKYAILLSPVPLLRVNDAKSVEYVGEIDVIGMGFSMVMRRRKPIYPALLEGSIIRIQAKKKINIDLLQEYGIYYMLGLISDFKVSQTNENEKRFNEYEILGKLGYGTILPLF